MKRILLLGLCLCTAGFIFAGGKSDDAAEGPTTVKYGFWGNPDAIGVEEDIINAFEAEHSDINIETVVSGYNEYHTKLLTMFAGGMAPDVMRVDSYFFQDFTSMNALRSIDDLVARDNIDLDVYYQQGIEGNSYEGELYGLPWGTAALYMLINLDMMEEAGIELPSLDWDMNDFTEIVEAFDQYDDMYGYSVELNSLSSLLPYIWGNGGDVFSEDLSKFAMNEKPAVDALDAMADLYNRGLIPSDSVTADQDILTRWFINNKVAMRMGSAAEMLSLQKVEGLRFEAWPMPGGAVVPNTTVFKTNIIGMSSKTKVTDDAWTFLKFLRGPEGKGETLYMEAKRIPPAIDDQKYWAMYADPTSYPKMIEENSRQIASTYGHNLPLRAGWLEIQQLVTPAYQQILLGESSAQEAMDQIAPKAQAVLDRTAK